VVLVFDYDVAPVTGIEIEIVVVVVVDGAALALVPAFL